MLQCYTDYFDSFLPVSPFHLGQMLQCAAILERISNDELMITSTSSHINTKVHFIARDYKDLLNWFGGDDLNDYRSRATGDSDDVEKEEWLWEKGDF